MTAKQSRPVNRDEIMALRLATNGLDRRHPLEPSQLRRAAWAGCKDSMPRAALLSLHARLESAPPNTLDRQDLTQVWGPGLSAYVVPTQDTAIFSLGRLPESGMRRTAAIEMAGALEPVLADGPITYREAGRILGVKPNRLRYAALTGTVALHWAGSGPPLISSLPAPEISPDGARRELGRRFLHVFGPATAADFAGWAGVPNQHAISVFAGLAPECLEVETPIGPAHILASDEPLLDTKRRVDGIRLLPSGDTFFIAHGAQRHVVVPDARRHRDLWTARVWPGALLVDGEVCGTWRRAGTTVTATSWRPMPASRRGEVETEAERLPLPEPIDRFLWV